VSWIDLVVATFSSMVLVMGYASGLLGYAVRGYIEAKERGENPVFKAFIKGVLAFFIVSSIVFIILSALEFVGFPVKQYIKNFSSGKTWEVEGGMGVDPETVAKTSVGVIACTYAYTMRVIVAVIPILLVLAVFSGYLLSRREQQQDTEGIFGKILVSFFMAVPVAFLVRAVYLVFQYWGVPMVGEGGIIDDVWNTMNIKLNLNLKVCPLNMQPPLVFLLSSMAFASKIGIMSVVMGIFFTSLLRQIKEGIDEYKERGTSPITISLRIASLMFLTLFFMYSIIVVMLGLVFVDYAKIVEWFGSWISRGFSIY